MDIQFLYYEDCPSHDEALERLKEVLNEEGVQAEIEIIKVETEQQAQKLKFIGSPTILIEGQDIAPAPPDSRYYLSCRVYQLEDGRSSPLPSREMIRKRILTSLRSKS
jgi:protein-disulfide isomerase